MQYSELNSKMGYQQNNQTESHNGLFDFIIIIIILLFSWSSIFKVIVAMNYLLMVLYFTCAFVQFKEKRYGCLFFYITFFLFLLGTVFFGLFDHDYKYKFASDDMECFVLVCLAIAIIGIYVGSVITKERSLTIGQRPIVIGKADRKYKWPSGKMQMFLKCAFIVCVQCSILEASVKAIFVSANSYIAYYSEFQTPLPYAVVWISAISPILFYFFLGTRPNKKSALLPCGLYLLVGVITLFYGQRNVIVIRTLIVVFYFFVRQKYDGQTETWITKKQIMLMIALIPLIIIFMSFWNSYRSDNKYEFKGIGDSIIEGLLEQGNNISILTYEYTYGDSLPDKPYAIGGIVALLHNNAISRILGVPPIPTKNHTVEMALEGYAYSGALMYLQNRNGYLAGFGIGSCYIAELFNTFGYIGIFIGSVIYGVVIKKLTRFKASGFISYGFALCMFDELLMAPRASYDGFFSLTIQIANIFIAVICWLLSVYVWPGGYSNE